MVKEKGTEMGNTKYREVCDIVDQLVELHKRNGAYDACAYTLGNLTAIVGLIVQGTLTPDEALTALARVRDRML
jgi:hypothetical protein